MKRKPRLLPVRIYGDEILRLKAREISALSPELKEFIADLTHTMYLRDGVGLAAPQVGESLRVIVIDPDWFREGRQKKPLVMINPRSMDAEGETDTEEGCISIPEVFAHVTRPSRVTLVYQDVELAERRLELEGYPAVIVQHEIDHLHGKLFTDRLSLLKRRTAMREWEEEKLKYPKLLRVLPVGDLPPERDAASAD